jgi:hypothetical protein
MTTSTLSVLAILLAAATTLSAAEAHRPLALHPDNPHYLLFRGRPAILITSGEHYGAVLNLEFDYIAYFDELQSKRLNQTRTFSGTYREVPGSFNITDNTLAPAPGKYIGPWARSDMPGASDGNKFDLTRFDNTYFARLKDFVAQAGRRGVVVEYVFFCTFYDDKLWAANPMNARNNINGLGTMPRTEVLTLKHKELLPIQEAFIRKVVAELKDFDNLYYEICNEPYFHGVSDEWQAWVARTIVDAEKDFPHKHLIAQNIANGSKRIEKPDPNVSIFNFHYATPPDAVALNYHLNKVIGDDETGFRGRDDVHYRTEGWDFIIAGGGIYSSLDYSFSVRHPAGTFTDFKSPGGGGPELRRQLGILRSFMEGFDFVRMKPMNQVVKGGEVTAGLSGTPARTGIISVRVLGEEGRAYAMYVRGGTSARIAVELPAGAYSVEWVNTRTGQVDKTEQIQGGASTLVSPAYAEDIAVRVVRR